MLYNKSRSGLHAHFNSKRKKSFFLILYESRWNAENTYFCLEICGNIWTSVLHTFDRIAMPARMFLRNICLQLLAWNIFAYLYIYSKGQLPLSWHLPALTYKLMIHFGRLNVSHLKNRLPLLRKEPQCNMRFTLSVPLNRLPLIPKRNEWPARSISKMR